MGKLEKFLTESAIAGKTELETRIILNRTQMNAREILAVKERGELEAPRKRKNLYELEAGGQIIAIGRLVKRRGKSYFKVVEAYPGFEKEVQNEQR